MCSEENVVQVDNVILQKNDGGSISDLQKLAKTPRRVSCAWLHTSPNGHRVEKLRTLSLTDLGTKISDPWQGSLSKGTSLRQETNKGEAIV